MAQAHRHGLRELDLVLVVLRVQVGHAHAHVMMPTGASLSSTSPIHGHLVARLGLEVLRHAVRGLSAPTSHRAPLRPVRFSIGVTA